jgi:deoxyribodipyrimidine photolyase
MTTFQDALGEARSELEDFAKHPQRYPSSRDFVKVHTLIRMTHSLSVGGRSDRYVRRVLFKLTAPWGLRTKTWLKENRAGVALLTQLAAQ